jgi:hypothetical protein
MPMQVSRALLAPNFPEETGQRPVNEIGEELLDDDLAAVLLSAWARVNGLSVEHGVVAPDREQHPLIVHSVLVCRALEGR